MAEIIGAIGAEIIGNQMNQKFNSRMMKKQQEFQENMYKHRYQWEMDDMKAAGMNPMLASGAAPPGPSSGGSAVGSDIDLSGALSSGLQLQRTESDLKTAGLQRENILSDSASKISQAELNAQLKDESVARAAKLVEETGKVRAETSSASAKAFQDQADALRRQTIGPKTFYSDIVESVGRSAQTLKKGLGLLNETPKAQATRDARPSPQPAAKPSPETTYDDIQVPVP